MLFRAISLLLRFLVLLMLARLFLRFVGGVVRGLRGEPAPGVRPGPGLGAEDLVRCAACRTHVPRARALVVEAGGREQAFCSLACRDGVPRAETPGLPAAPVHLE